jgi:hypothetical protein
VEDDVAEVIIDRAGSGGWAVSISLHTAATVRLDVTQVPFRGPFLGKLERDAAAVREWLGGRPRSFL